MGMWVKFAGSPTVRVAAFPTLCAVGFTILAMGLQHHMGGYSADLSNTGDEAGHFTTAAMIHDYITQAIGTSPLKFAVDYYGHFPRVSFGHWPPLFHIAQAVAFIATGVGKNAALWLQAAIFGVLGVTVAGVVARRTRWWVGLCAAAVLLSNPQATYQLNTIMLDNLLGLLVLLSALAWAVYARTGTMRASIAFGICASAAIMTKGNAYGLALLPVLHAVLSGRVGLLLAPRTFVSAAIVLVVTGPWYALTYKIASDGFVYHWGLDYSRIAVPVFVAGLAGIMGAVGLMLFLAGTALSVRRAWAGTRDDVVLACAAAAAGMMIFQCIVPADISPRYVISIFPSAVVVVALSLDKLIRLARPSLSPGAMSAVLAAVLLIDAGIVFHLPHLGSNKMDLVAQDIMADPDDRPLVLVSSNSYGEGALIAAFAELDRARTHYVVRATKALSSSDFMGRGYRARFDSPGDVAHWIEASRIGWVVITIPLKPTEMLHEREMIELAATPPSNWRYVSEQHTINGVTQLYKVEGPAASQADIESVIRQVAPTKIM